MSTTSPNTHPPSSWENFKELWNPLILLLVLSMIGSVSLGVGMLPEKIERQQVIIKADTLLEEVGDQPKQAISAGMMPR